MKRLRAFWYVYRKSLIDVDYYKDLLKVKADFSIKYFLSLAALATFLTTIRLAVPTIRMVNSVYNNLLDEFSAIYPDELVITVQDGMWEINKAEPFIIESPSFFEEGELEGEEVDIPDNLIVFDHRGTINDLRLYDSFMLMNNVNLVVVNAQRTIEAYPLDTLPDGQVTKADVDLLIAKGRSFSKYIPWLIIGFVLLGSLFYFIAFRFLYLFIVALILLAYGNMIKLKKSFRTYYKLALHTITLPLTMEVAFVMLGIEPNFEYWFLGFNMFFGIVVVHHLTKKKAKSK